MDAVKQHIDQTKIFLRRAQDAKNLDEKASHLEAAVIMFKKAMTAFANKIQR